MAFQVRLRGWWGAGREAPDLTGRAEICPFERVDLANASSVHAALQRCPLGPVDIVLTHDALQHIQAPQPTPF